MLGLGVGAARGAVAGGADGLREDADVGHDGDAVVDEGADDLGAGLAAFELDGVGAAFAQEAPGVVERLHGRAVG